MCGNKYAKGKDSSRPRHREKKEEVRKSTTQEERQQHETKYTKKLKKTKGNKAKAYGDTRPHFFLWKNTKKS